MDSDRVVSHFFDLQNANMYRVLETVLFKSCGVEVWGRQVKGGRVDSEKGLKGVMNEDG